MANPDYTADPKSQPFEVLGIPETTPYPEIKKRTKELYKKIDDDDKQSKVMEALKNIPEREVAQGVELIPLSLEVNKPEVEFGSKVTFTVTDDRGRDIQGATIFKDDGQRVDNTDSNGECQHTMMPASIGSVRFIAEKDHNGSDRSFKDGTVEVKVTPQSHKLQFVRCPDSVTVGDTIDIKVEGKNGGENDCQISIDGAVQGKTDRNGEANISIPAQSLGTNVPITASKGRDGNKKYTDASESIDIYKRSVQLHIKQAPSEVAVGDSATFQITVDGSPERGVTVKHSQDSDQTDNNGYATLSFADLPLGKESVNASKQDQGGVGYSPDSTDVRVTEREVGLNLQQCEQKVYVDEPATFKVEDDSGQPVSNAHLTGQNIVDVKTRVNGEADVTFSQPAQHLVEVTKTDDPKVQYGTDDLTVNVDRRTEQLAVEALDHKIEVGEDFEVRVTGDNDQPIENAEVSAKNGTTDTTNAMGKARVTFNKSDKQRVKVSKDPDRTKKYKSTSLSTHVKEPPKELSISKAPDTQVGTPVIIKVLDHKNQGAKDITVKVTGGGISKEKKTDGNGEARFDFSSADITPPEWMDVEAIDFNDKFDNFAKDVFKLEP